MKNTTRNQAVNIIEQLACEVLEENNTAGSGGVFGLSAEIGQHGGDVGNSDWYAPGDARNLFGSGEKKKKKKKKSVKGRKKTKTKGKKKNAKRGTSTILPMTRRS
tara:strand:- start:4984 stop:5298 length:315 start_codon:yes stop_codon:yes gene_type:complete